MIVVTDTSVVLNLAWLQHGGLLPLLYEAILAPPIVRAEFERLSWSDNRFRGLVFPAFIRVEAPLSTAPALVQK